LKIAEGETPYWGKVKTWDVEKKRGFIMCEEVYAQHEQDVYVFDTILRGCGAAPGDTVAFFLHISEKTHLPQVSAPILRIGAKGGFAHKGRFKRVPDKEHGFLECSETHDFFGRDVYVNKDAAALLQPNDLVCFNVKLNFDKMPNIDDKFELVDEFWEPVPGDLSQSRTDPVVEMQRFVMKGKSKGMDPEAMARHLQKIAAETGASHEELNSMVVSVLTTPAEKGFGKGGPQNATRTGEVFTGRIKSFSADNNYGFIASDACTAKYNRDCFFSGKLVEGARVVCKAGAEVEFDIGVNNRNQPQALSLRMLGSTAPPLSAQQPALSQSAFSAQPGLAHAYPTQPAPQIYSYPPLPPQQVPAHLTQTQYSAQQALAQTIQITSVTQPDYAHQLSVQPVGYPYGLPSADEPAAKRTRWA